MRFDSWIKNIFKFCWFEKKYRQTAARDVGVDDHHAVEFWVEGLSGELQINLGLWVFNNEPFFKLICQLNN